MGEFAGPVVRIELPLSPWKRRTRDRGDDTKSLAAAWRGADRSTGSVTPLPDAGGTQPDYEPQATPRPSGRKTTAWFALTRAATIALLFVPGLHESLIKHDVVYYAHNIHTMFASWSTQHALPEYPLPTMAIMVPQYLISGANVHAFLAVFAASIVMLDAVFTWKLWQASARGGTAALAVWLAFVPAIGPLAYFRFDLVPSLLTGLAIVALARRPAVAGTVTAWGTAIKLWPALTLPMLMAYPGARRAVLSRFVYTGLAVSAVTFALGGWTRAVSPLRWQLDRGLQIESVPATPLMLIRAAHPRPWHVAVSVWQTTEVFGPAVDLTLFITFIAEVASLIVLAWLTLRIWRTPGIGIAPIAWLALTTSLVVIVTNKAFSPQYVLWLGGAVVALHLCVPRDPLLRRVTGLILLASVMTQLEYPIFYAEVVNIGPGTFACTLLLSARNVLLCYITWISARRVYALTRHGQVPG